MTLPAPNIEFAALSPMLIVFGAGILGILLEALLPRDRRYPAQVTLNGTALCAAFIAVILQTGHQGHAVMGSVTIDGPTLFLQGAILMASAISIAPIGSRRLAAFTPQGSSVPGSADERDAQREGALQTEVFPLFMFAVGGMLLLPAASDLLTIFIAVEVLSLPLYVLCGLARTRRLLSHEAALKYFLLGAFSSAIFLYGMGLLYGYAGTLTLSGIATALDERGETSLALIGVALLTAGLLFKVGAVPFHSWVPDVYQGAPTPVTAFMAAATKLAAFGAMLRIFYVALPRLVTDWRPVLCVIAALTMVVAAVLTVVQTDIKRLLGFSAVVNAGFLLLGVTGTEAGLSSTLFYLVAYAVSTIGAFATVTMIRGPDGDEETDTSRWAGLGQRSPAVASAMALFLLAIAGIPLTSGFVSKFAIFQTAAADGAGVLVVIGVLASAVAAYAYARVIVTMFFNPPNTAAPQAERPALATTAVVTMAAAATILLGILPQPLFDLTINAGDFIR
ncbi:NADH-quinone oxidoreductase subunit N [Mycolicibacterium moriokaense]|uniref:NADH-quinone oxidoreductase subunit N n=1 Tax=Mycolicibacterium moriokaense TaxID=39691 RepID=A0AAD1HCP2_9MYCO|nr:NADH-quinone oxidoreductase subunit NuoN [Mycolicibacterium moriokaense]MCV7041646.1 NADH-quinone oxidoreductase subunit NuoN [Mycolicibacterium moriokaense]ORB21923.1 NADH-quinone oxidoreductase subunit N [Mycolicibacterium moriokaense]BBX01568.1 NADH-quinone oxidoreductase subunit N [Mycolicibacterium moriokaense]